MFEDDSKPTNDEFFDNNNNNNNTSDKNQSDYFVYISWSEDWVLEKYVDPKLVYLNIPNLYLDDYNIKIDNIDINNISENIFSEGVNHKLRINKEPLRDNLPLYSDWLIDDRKYENIKLKQNTEKINSALIEIEVDSLAKNID